MTDQVISFRDQRGWAQYHSPKDLALGMMVEVSELAEHFQYWQGEELVENLKKAQIDVGEELSDVLYWVLLTAHEMDIDLVAAFRRKMKLNAVKYPATLPVAEGIQSKFEKQKKMQE